LSDYAKVTDLQEYVKSEALEEYAKVEDLSKYMLKTHPAAAITSEQIHGWNSSISQLEQLTDRVNNL
jgi:hypothetical protein